MIEGENLGALQALVARAPNSVDLVYLDPPYNTSRRLTYQGRHEDWAGSLQIRLALARELLSALGVIVIAVGDAELGRLRVICDELFGARNHLTTLVWQGDAHSGRRFGGGGVDYMVVYGRSKAAMMRADLRWREPKDGVDDIMAAGADAWAESGGSAEHATGLLRAWWRGRKDQYAAGLREYSRVDELGRVFRIGTLASPAGRGSGRYSVLHPATGLPVKLPPGDWAAPASTMASYISEGRVLFGPDETSMPYRRLFLDEQLDGVPLPVFRQSRASGTQHLARVFSGEQRFSHPKDHLVLARWFKMMAGPDAQFLDFYAGSGTTAEAVMHLNAEDGGTRRAILVTNNEVPATEQKTLGLAGHSAGDAEWEVRGVYRWVCRPRIETTVTGVREDGTRFSDGYEENVSFYRAD